MEPRLAIDGPGWSVSFQRRVGAANRGVLPFVRLDAPSDQVRVLVPLRDDEALWMAVIADPEIAVHGRAGREPLRVERWAPAKDGSIMHALDAVLRADRPLPLDAASIDLADVSAAINTDVLTLLLEGPTQAATWQISIVPVTPRLYEALSGCTAPAPTTERDEYRGWRLP